MAGIIPLRKYRTFWLPLLKKKITIHYDNKLRPNDVNEMVADISKVSKEFNWKPSTSLKEGLEATLRRFES